MQISRSWLAVVALCAASVLTFTNQASAVTGGTILTPDTTVDVTPGNLNGWTQNAFLDWAPGDPTVRGANAEFVNNTTAPAGTANGAWSHSAVYPSIPNFAENAYYELQFGGIAGTLVSALEGFAYRNFQMTAGSAHAGVLFEIDADGDLINTTADTIYIRFQPILYGQATGSGNPTGEWNEFGAGDSSVRFLDAVNAGNVNQKAFQSVDSLFLDTIAKPGTAGGAPVVLGANAAFRSVIIAGGLQGVPLVEEYIDYIQFSFDTGTAGVQTTRYDFGAAAAATNPIPEPVSAGLLALGGVALLARRRRLA